MTKTKATKTKPAKKAKAAPVPEAAAPGECPKGGKQEWDDEHGERFCTKCKEPAPAKGKKTKPAKAKRAKPAKEKGLSAIDAAAQVLSSSKEPLNAKEMIEQMATKGLWSSPGGKTPHATLYSAIIREISLKGRESRFTKKERGKFAAK
jgi:hypothetical protein